MNRDFLRENPDYIEMVKRILEYQENNKDPDHRYIQDEEYESCWDYKDVGCSPQRLFQLEVNNVIERVFDTNSTTAYTLTDPEGAKEIAENSVGKGEAKDCIYDFPDEDDLPEDLFSDVIGYPRVKWLLKRALTTDDIVNVLLVGPPGSAKTVFLMCINELENSIFVSGKPSSGPGVLDMMFEEAPMYLAIDEFDDMGNDTQEVLSQHMDTGILDETKVGKNRKMEINTNTFGSANSLGGVIDQVEDRFVDLHFDPYSKDEFEEICEHLLPKREGSTEEEARRIAEEIWKMNKSGDIRKAISVARLSRGDPEKVLDVIGDYTASPLKTF